MGEIQGGADQFDVFLSMKECSSSTFGGCFSKGSIDDHLAFLSEQFSDSLVCSLHTHNITFQSCDANK